MEGQRTTTAVARGRGDGVIDGFWMVRCTADNLDCVPCAPKVQRESSSASTTLSPLHLR